ncbi:hypothetical protein [Marinomonas fungiae]|uniref:hypothetical protein n=1 Tax=Marinomonas fungiae TaxID=1137284 RepID=UPI003A8E48AD
MGFIAESGAGYPSMSARRMDNEEHDIETTGAELHELIRWEVMPELENHQINV